MNLWERWLELASELGLAADRSAAEFTSLAQRYTEGHRFYHNLSHVERVLRVLDPVAELLVDATGVKLALWFHDIDYDVNQTDNEERSAERLRTFCEQHSVMCVNTAVDLVLATKHQKSPAAGDASFVVDADFSVFGCPWSEYAAYMSGVRAEFVGRYVLPTGGLCGDKDFDHGRADFLKKLPRNPFSTEFFRQRYGVQAADNIDRELSLLNV